MLDNPWGSVDDSDDETNMLISDEMRERGEESWIVKHWTKNKSRC